MFNLATLSLIPGKERERHSRALGLADEPVLTNGEASDSVRGYVLKEQGVWQFRKTPSTVCGLRLSSPPIQMCTMSLNSEEQ